MEVNKHKNSDQIFREKLYDHEVSPPVHIWQGIQAGSAAGSSSWRWWAAAGIVAFILGTASYFYISSDSSETEKSLSKQNIESVDTQIQESTTPEITSSENTENSEEVEQEIIQELEQSFQVEEQVGQVTEVSNNNEESTSQEMDVSEANIQDVLVTTYDGNAIDSQEGNIQYNNKNQIPDNTIEKQANKAGYDFFDEEVTQDILQGHNKHKRWELGIEFSPEWITIPENDNNIKSYGLELSARYHFSKWFIETGVGAALSKDDGIYRVDTIYRNKGSYWDVYNVTFDESGNEPTPIYHTELKNVYAAYDTRYVYRGQNDYVYINIPINVGYSTELSKQFTLYFKSGIITSFKVYEHIPEYKKPDLNEGDLIKEQPVYFNRTPWHMQAQLNVGINYYLTNRFIFGVEPNARYYIKSLVEDNPGGNPYGFGVKIGFKYVIKK